MTTVMVSGAASQPTRLFGPLIDLLPQCRVQLLPLLAGDLVREGAESYDALLDATAVEDAVDRSTAAGGSPGDVDPGRPFVDLVGFSGGCTGVLLHLARHPATVRRVVLFEPAWLGNDPACSYEEDYRHELDQLMDLPDEDLWQAFVTFMAPRRTTRRDPSTGPDRQTLAGVRLAWRAWRAAGGHGSVLSALVGLPVPLLVVAGGRSHARMLPAAGHLASLSHTYRLHDEALADHVDIVRVGAEAAARHLCAPDPTQGDAGCPQ